jgi:ribosome recycling factor
MGIESLYADTEVKMKRTLENLRKEFSRIRTGRATPALLDGIHVDYYGSQTPVSQVANISTPDARTIAIQPWEKSMVPIIEKAVRASNLDINPVSDGNIIRLPIPPLSTERRADLVKTCKRIDEEEKVAMRNIRRDANETLKKAEKDKLLTQDEHKKHADEIQKLTDRYIKTIDDQLALKEKEILEQ